MPYWSAVQASEPLKIEFLEGAFHKLHKHVEHTSEQACVPVRYAGVCACSGLRGRIFNVNKDELQVEAKQSSHSTGCSMKGRSNTATHSPDLDSAALAQIVGGIVTRESCCRRTRL
jgi:hypothetical protein